MRGKEEKKMKEEEKMMPKWVLMMIVKIIYLLQKNTSQSIKSSNNMKGKCLKSEKRLFTFSFLSFIFSLYTLKVDHEDTDNDTIFI